MSVELEMDTVSVFHIRPSTRTVVLGMGLFQTAVSCLAWYIVQKGRILFIVVQKGSLRLDHDVS